MQETDGEAAIRIIQKAVAGSSETIEQILAYYDGYISKLATVTRRSEEGVYYPYVDEDMKAQLQETLAHAIRCFDLEGVLQNGRYSKRKSTSIQNQMRRLKSDDTNKSV